MHDGMVMANKGFQDKMFKLYTGQSLKGVSSADTRRLVSALQSILMTRSPSVLLSSSLWIFHSFFSVPSLTRSFFLVSVC